MARKRVSRTSTPMFPEHPLEEHKWRVTKARRIMAEDGLDALLLARNINVFYLSGSRFVFVGMDAPTALAPQSAVIITPDADIYCQRFGPFDSDEVGLHTTHSESLEFYDNELELVNILKDYGIGRGARIGTEWGPGLTVGINPIKFMELKKRVAEELSAELVDGTTTMCKVTAVKSALEVERMKVAVNAAACAMRRIYDVIQLGMNELEVKHLANQFMLEEGGDALSHAQVMAEGEEALSFLSCDALDRVIGRGWVHLDMGCKYKRYGSDINRGLFLGREPTQEEEKIFTVRAGVNGVLDRVIKPGVSVDEAIRAAKEYVESQGCVLKELGGSDFLGHNLGLEPYQSPNLIPSSKQPAFQNKDGQVVFEPGMMFTYEMVVDLPGAKTRAFFNMEDDMVVTESGVENMNAAVDREIHVKY